MAIPDQGIIVAKQTPRTNQLAPRSILNLPSAALGVAIKYKTGHSGLA